MLTSGRRIIVIVTRGAQMKTDTLSDSIIVLRFKQYKYVPYAMATKVIFYEKCVRQRATLFSIK